MDLPEPKPIRDWTAIRREYESSAISHRSLARKLNLPYSTLAKHAMRGKWQQRARQLRAAATKLDSITAETVDRQIREELQPWIEQQKLALTRRGYEVAHKGLERVEKMFKQSKIPEPKSESFIAKSAESWHRMGRIALGMNDGSPTGGAINVNVLTNQAAIQVVTPNDE